MTMDIDSMCIVLVCVYRWAKHMLTAMFGLKLILVYLKSTRSILSRPLSRTALARAYATNVVAERRF
jgi:hypothetical protein